MLDHITLRVSNIETTIRFYSAALAPLGYPLMFDETFDGVRVIGFGKESKINTWFTNESPLSEHVHVCWKAQSRREVDEFYKHGLGAGGRDNGAPGIRMEYHDNYYGAFLFDPDDNNVEAVFGN